MERIELLRRPILGKPLFQPCLARIAVWSARARERRMLPELDDRSLKDLGLSRADARREAALLAPLIRGHHTYFREDRHEGSKSTNGLHPFDERWNEAQVSDLGGRAACNYGDAVPISNYGDAMTIGHFANKYHVPVNPVSRPRKSKYHVPVNPRPRKSDHVPVNRAARPFRRG